MLIAAVTRTDLVSPRAIGTLFVSDGIDAAEMYPPIYKSKFFCLADTAKPPSRCSQSDSKTVPRS